MTNVVLRAAAHADVPVLADFARRSFAATYAATHDGERIRTHCDTVLSEAAVMTWLDAPDARIVVAEAASGLLGFVQWLPAEAPVPARLSIELKRLYVDPAAHGTGIARSLFDSARNDARMRGADLLWLCVYDGNHRALRFYARQGLVEIGRVPYRFVDQVEDDLALGLRFTPARPESTGRGYTRSLFNKPDAEP
jgi:ribosomal protein S18 acetylase RimI-like enzyme